MRTNREDFQISDEEVSRGIWRLPLLEPIEDKDLPELVLRYMEWRLRVANFYQITPNLWIERGKDIEISDEVYISDTMNVTGNGTQLDTLPQFDRWITAGSI